MRFEFDYPALVSAVPHGKRVARDVLVEMRTEAEVVEMDSHAAPLALTFCWGDRKFEYRHFDGGFYLPSDLDLKFYGRALTPTVPNGLSTVATDAIAYRLVCEMASLEGRQKEKVWRPMKEVLYDTAINAGSGYLEDICHPRPRNGFEKEFVFSEVGTLDSINENDVEYWRDMAVKVASRNVMIDGRIWMRVAEPLLERSTSSLVALANMDIFAQPRSRSVPLQPPFGQGRHYGGAYWQFEFEYRPVTEVPEFIHRALNATSSTPLRALETMNVMLPGVFGVDFERHDLVRASRTSLIDIWNSSYGPHKTMSAPLRAAFETLKEAVHPYNGEPADCDGLADCLEMLLNEWEAMADRSNWREPESATRLRSFETATLAVERWRERPIAVDQLLAPQSRQPRF